MTREEAQKILTMWMVSSRGADGQRGYIEGWFDKDDVEAFRMAIKALSSEDIQEVDSVTIHNEGITFSYRKTGEWINKDGGLANCSICGERWGVWDVMNFCPHCGARLYKGGEDE